ncbi:hypothetical protein Mapa_006839 [Marchantia paleacea]|nr:hypothetical protein Mapa_006839 [Marchantia paleacea]
MSTHGQHASRLRPGSSQCQQPSSPSSPSVPSHDLVKSVEGYCCRRWELGCSSLAAPSP